MASAASRIRAGWISLLAGSAITAGKLAIAGLTDSAALLSDALESLVNVAAAALLLYTLVVASRPADRDHPYGHGKIEFFSAGAEGALIGVAALAILVEAVRHLVRGPSIRSLDLGILLATGMAAANAALGAYLVASGRRHDSDALAADGRHVLTDVVTTAGVVVGLVLVRLTGVVWLDPLFAIAVAISILYTGWRLLRGAVGGLMDEAEPGLLEPIAAALEREREPHWIDVHSLRTLRSGAIQHADLHLSVPRYFDADRLHEIDARVHGVVLGATGRPGDVIVHFDPCRPRQCPICRVEPCPVRAAPFRARPPIGLERAVRGDEELDDGAELPPLAAHR